MKRSRDAIGEVEVEVEIYYPRFSRWGWGGEQRRGNADAFKSEDGEDAVGDVAEA